MDAVVDTVMTKVISFSDFLLSKPRSTLAKLWTL